MARCDTWRSSFCWLRRPFDDSFSKSARSRDGRSRRLVGKGDEHYPMMENMETNGDSSCRQRHLELRVMLV